MAMPGMIELAKTEYDQASTKVGETHYYEVFGDDMQILHLKMSMGNKILAAPGTMVYMEPEISPSVNCDNMCGRCLSCNHCIFPSYSNTKGTETFNTVGISPGLPAKIIPVKIAGEEKVRCREGTFLASAGSVSLGIDFNCNPFTACCGGQGCVNQTLKSPGGEGVGFLSAMGTIMEKTLGPGEVIELDTNAALAWDSTAELNIKLAGGLCAICFGGEGLFNTTLTGPGRVWFQSYSYEKYKEAMIQYVLTGKGGASNQSILGGAPEVEQEMER